MDELIMIVAQLKYDLQSIESKIESIKDTKEKMKLWEGRPIYKSCEDLIAKWNIEILEHRKMVDEYYLRFSSIQEDKYYEI